MNESGENFLRKERVRRREDFIRLFRNGSRYHAPQYTMVIVRNDVGYTRFAISVSKKVGSAVVRNYEKRLCREFFRREKGKLITGYDILILVKRSTERFQQSYQRLKDLLLQAFGTVAEQHIL